MSEKLYVGATVKSKVYENRYGVCEFSIFGYSIHYYDEETNTFAKTIGSPEHSVSKYWEVCDMPDGYEVCDNGLIKRKQDNYE